MADQQLKSDESGRFNMIVSLDARPMFAVGLYGTAAVAMGFVNKAVLSVYGFRESNVLLLLQQGAAVLVLRAIAAAGFIQLEPFTWARSRQLLYVSALYNANVAFALASLASLNIPMYMTLKRLTPALVLVASYVNGSSKPSSRVAKSVGMIITGCLIAGYGDLSFDLKAYVYAFSSCGLQAAYFLCVESTCAEQGMDSTNILHYNALLSLLPLLVVTLVTGEVASSSGKLQEMARDFEFAITFAAALSLGLVLNYSQFLCTELNSALTTTVVGAVKGVVATTLGFFLLGGVGRTSSLNLAGIIINGAGGICYTYAKWTEKQSKSTYARVSPDEQHEPEHTEVPCSSIGAPSH